MGAKRKKRMGAVAWYVHRAAVSCSGKPPLESRFGPFVSRREAEEWQREDEERPGHDGYEYTYTIEGEPTALLNIKPR
jgi:hypothetical protein